MYTKQTPEKANNSDNTTKQKLYVPKRLSIINSFILLLSILLLAISGVLFLFHYMSPKLTINQLSVLFNSLFDYVPIFMTWGIVLLIVAIVLIIFDNLRIPPPRWKIKQELICALIDLHLLDNDVLAIKRQLRICPFIKYSSKSKSMKVHFLLCNGLADDEKLRRLTEITAFKYAQSVELENHLNSRGRIRGHNLIIYYETEQNIFNKLTKGVKNGF